MTSQVLITKLVIRVATKDDVWINQNAPGNIDNNLVVTYQHTSSGRSEGTFSDRLTSSEQKAIDASNSKTVSNYRTQGGDEYENISSYSATIFNKKPQPLKPVFPDDEVIPKKAFWKRGTLNIRFKVREHLYHNFMVARSKIEVEARKLKNMPEVHIVIKSNIGVSQETFDDFLVNGISQAGQNLMDARNKR